MKVIISNKVIKYEWPTKNIYRAVGYQLSVIEETVNVEIES